MSLGKVVAYPELFGTACTKRVVAQESSTDEVVPSK